MANTATVRVYCVREDVDADELISALAVAGYHQLQLHSDTQVLQSVQAISVRAVARVNHSTPDLARMVNPYLATGNHIEGFVKHDLIVLAQLTSASGRTFTFALCLGAGYYDVAPYLDYTFGVSILEAMFDPSVNKIKSIEEKGIIGDILASRRFYRRARPIAYEDDFGKYYRTIDVGFRDSQIRAKLPNFARRQGARLKSSLSVSGSSSVQVGARIDFVTLVLLLKDVAELAASNPPTFFNRALVPLDRRRSAAQLGDLDEILFLRLAEFCADPQSEPVEFDFCHRDFDAFFSSARCSLTIRGVSDGRGRPIRIETEDLYELNGCRFLFEVSDQLKSSREYHLSPDPRSFLKDKLRSAEVATINDEGQQTTSGRLKEYIQAEILKDGVSYFLLDNNWYQLQSQFDATLAQKYRDGIGRQVRVHPFIKPWNCADEHTYNQLYDDQPQSYCLHQVKVDRAELCDALVINSDQRTVFLIHVKDGLGATVRDLTSQAHMAARIIEEDTRTESKDRLRKLFRQAVSSRRIDPSSISEADFLQTITTFRREYVLAVHSGHIECDLVEGNFGSRIAKFSLVEFASAMRLNGWSFSLCNVIDAAPC